MPLLSAFQLREAQIYLWKLTETLEELQTMVEDGKELREKAERLFSNDCRKRQWLLSRLLVKKFYGEQCEIDYLPGGKPVLKGRVGHISISHTADCLALAYSEKSAIGIDIEQWSPRALRLSGRFLFPEEYTTSENEATALWSAKEAVYKLADGAYQVVSDIRLRACASRPNRYVVQEAEPGIELERRDFTDFVLTLANYSS